MALYRTTASHYNSWSTSQSLSSKADSGPEASLSTHWEHRLSGSYLPMDLFTAHSLQAIVHNNASMEMSQSSQTASPLTANRSFHEIEAAWGQLTSVCFKCAELWGCIRSLVVAKMETGFLTKVLLIAILHISVTSGQDYTEVSACLEHQEAFDGSCYEFVAQQRTFQSAQRWCERGGGHLAFIQNDETQQFFQRQLQPQQDWWVGLAPASINLTLDSAAAEGNTRAVIKKADHPDLVCCLSTYSYNCTLNDGLNTWHEQNRAFLMVFIFKTCTGRCERGDVNENHVSKPLIVQVVPTKLFVWGVCVYVCVCVCVCVCV